MFVCVTSHAAEPAHWTTGRVRGTPEPPKPFVAGRVFAGIDLSNVLDMVAVPGLDQWAFVQNEGRILVVANDLRATQTTVALDVKAAHPACDHVYAVAFHPRFATNRQVFITYTNGDKLEDGSRLARFKVVQDRPLRIDPSTEEILLTWPSGGHNGAAIQFGPDGCLYLSTGDAEVPNPPDPRATGQDLDDLLSCILRVNVDHQGEGGKYSVPADNPFIATPGARPEIWAYGFRNPWKMSFDMRSGRLWCGDVGWQQWENVFLVTRGGNYGWSATEGNNVILPERRGPTPISPPVVTHGREEAASVTGGYVYHGTRLPELQGAYVYGDYETGNIWALWHDGRQITRHEQIATTPLKIVTFGQGEDGELYFVHYGRPALVHRLERNPRAGEPSRFPRRLSETGLFRDVARQVPAEGVHRYGVRAAMWADGAQGERFLALPSGAVQTKVVFDTEGRPTSARFTWPADAVLAKTLSVELEHGNPASAKRVETQMLHFDGDTWAAYSYRWNEDGTDADLVGVNGDERQLVLTGGEFPGGRRRYQWRFHSRAECLRCHNLWNGFAISPQAQQLNETDARVLMSLGLLDPDHSRSSDARLVDPHDERQSLEARARSWLHANCAHCHRTHGGGSVPLTVNVEVPVAEMHALDERPMRGDFGMQDARVIMPGNPWRSVLLHRIATSGPEHMPVVGTRDVDQAGLALLARWVESLKPDAITPPVATLERAAAEPAAALAMVVEKPTEMSRVLRLAATSTNAHVRNLFDRFLPDEQRVELLGPGATAESILARRGDAGRGAVLFSLSGKASTCLSCHFLKGSGRDFGPDLSGVGARLAKAQILGSILTPSKVITPGYQAVGLTLQDGDPLFGFILKRGEGRLTLKIATGQALPLTEGAIKTEQVLPTSLMPEGLLQGFTAQEAADLVEYLSTLK